MITTLPFRSSATEPQHKLSGTDAGGKKLLYVQHKRALWEVINLVNGGSNLRMNVR